MRRLLLLSIALLFISLFANSQGLNIGDKAPEFALKNVDGKNVSINDFKNSKGIIVVFTCNHCPYAQAYEERIIQLDKKYKPLGFPVIAINPNDPSIQPGDSYENMQKRAKEKGYPFPYLFDDKQEVYRKFGATRTPHLFVLQRDKKDLIVKYIGTVDDNYEDPSKVTTPYVANAVEALLAGREPNPTTTKAVGCTIKDKRNK